LPIARRKRRRRERKSKEKKDKERTMYSPVNSNLPGGNIVRRRERVLLFIKQGENTPNL